MIDAPFLGRRIVVPVAARADGWIQALADCTGLPVHVRGSRRRRARRAFWPDGCGLETTTNDAARWRTERIVEPAGDGGCRPPRAVCSIAG